MRHNIVRVHDGCGSTKLLNEFGVDPVDASFNRVVRQLEGGYEYRFAYARFPWVEPRPAYLDTPAARTVVCNPDGGRWVYSFNYRGDLIDERARLIRDGIGAPAGALAPVRRARQPDIARRAQWPPHRVALGGRPRRPARLAQPAARVELRAADSLLLASRIVYRAEYTPAGLLRREHREDGTRVEYRYAVDDDPIGGGPHLMRISDGPATGGPMATVAFVRDDHGRVVRVTSPEGDVTQTRYFDEAQPAAGWVEQLVHGDGDDALVTTLEYDAFGNVTALTDPAGSRSERTYDATGHVSMQTLPAVGSGPTHWFFGSGRRRAARRGARATRNVRRPSDRWRPRAPSDRARSPRARDPRGRGEQHEPSPCASDRA